MRDYIITRELPNKEDELEHYGVPGMKWGHRKASTQITNSSKTVNKKKQTHS